MVKKASTMMTVATLRPKCPYRMQTEFGIKEMPLWKKSQTEPMTMANQPMEFLDKMDKLELDKMDH